MLLLCWLFIVAVHGIDIYLDEVKSLGDFYYLSENTIVNLKCNNNKNYSGNSGNMCWAVPLCGRSFKFEYCNNTLCDNNDLFVGEPNLNDTRLIVFERKNFGRYCPVVFVLSFFVKYTKIINLDSISVFKPKYYLPENTTVTLKCDEEKYYGDKFCRNTTICGESLKLQYCGIRLCDIGIFIRYDFNDIRPEFTALAVFEKNNENCTVAHQLIYIKNRTKIILTPTPTSTSILISSTIINSTNSGSTKPCINFIIICLKLIAFNILH